MVAPLAGAWIEIHRRLEKASRELVAPLAGAWIEINPWLWCRRKSRVAPLAGAWIEIGSSCWSFWAMPVAPLAGAWIEIQTLADNTRECRSHPSRVRGLKLSEFYEAMMRLGRTPRGCVD